MVFPVFARARESARKAVCLSNVKNIALAVQMYLADNNDTLPPQEHRAITDDWAAMACDVEGWNPVAATYANPYLRWPVILDEYVKNREVYTCPSAKVESAAVGINPEPDWYSWLLLHGESGDGTLWSWDTPWGQGTFCWWNGAWYPPGWGGAVTDSYLQGPAWGVYGGSEERANTAKVFTMSIACNAGSPEGLARSAGAPCNWDRKLVTVPDPVKWVIVADSGVKGTQNFLPYIGKVAYPELCGMGCSGCDQCAFADWEMCSDPAMGGDCVYMWAPVGGGLITDKDAAKAYARHLGGVNIGFLDGHAAWWNSQRLIAEFADGVRAGEQWPLGLGHVGPASVAGAGGVLPGTWGTCGAPVEMLY